MFGRARKFEARLEALERAFAQALEALKEASGTASQKEPFSTLVEGFGKAFSGMAEALAASNLHVSKLTTEALDRANRVAARNSAHEMAEKSKLVRAERKALLQTLPPFVARCEECLAIVQARSPRSETDLARHHSEGHIAELTRLGAVPKDMGN